jgi:hypothetical protein
MVLGREPPLLVGQLRVLDRSDKSPVVPTGQCWNLDIPSRIDLSDAPGTQIVVKRWPLLHRTIVSPPMPE